MSKMYACKKCNDDYGLTATHLDKKFCSKSCRTIYTNAKNRENNRKRKKGADIYQMCARYSCANVFRKNSSEHKYCGTKECKRIIAEERLESERKITYYDIFEYDDFRCQYCGATPTDGARLVVDHIYPIAEGGRSERFNLTTSCEPCNARKGTRMLSLKQTLRRWEKNKKFFTYEGAKEKWEEIQESREDKNKINYA